MPDPIAALLLPVGRALLASLFVIGGARHFLILPLLTGAMAARGVPAPRLVLVAGSLFEVACGLLLMAGLFVPWAALGLIVFTGAASVMMLNFWDMQGEARANTAQAWLSNIALVGGLLLAAASDL